MTRTVESALTLVLPTMAPMTTRKMSGNRNVKMNAIRVRHRSRIA